MLTKTSLDLQHKGFARLFKSIIAPAAPAPADTIITNPKQWAKGMLKSNHVLTVLDDCWDKIVSNPGADLALCEIVHSAVDHVSEWRDNALEVIADRIMSEAKDAMQAYHNKVRAYAEKKAKDKSARMDIKRGERPVDICRTYYRPLKLLADLGFPTSLMAEEMLLECSMPESEVLNPDWIDPYTGEIDKEGFEMAEIRIGRLSDAGNDDDVVDELGWTKSEREEFAKAQEGFNAEDGLDGEDIEDDMGDVRSPIWMDMQKDLAPSENLKELRDGCRGLTKLLYKVIRENSDLPEDEAQAAFRESDEAISYLLHLQDLATHDIQVLEERLVDGQIKKIWVTKITGEKAADIACMFLAFQHEHAFTEEDASQIKVIDSREVAIDPAVIDAYTTPLSEWLDINGDEFLEQFSQIEMHKTGLYFDASPAHRETTQAEIEQFADETLKELVKVTADSTSKDITMSPAFLEAYYTVQLEARQTSSVDAKGKWHDHAQEAGWTAWRRSMSVQAARAYDKALSSGKTPKEAMAAFWRQYNADLDALNKALHNGTATVALSTIRTDLWEQAAEDKPFASIFENGPKLIKLLDQVEKAVAERDEKRTARPQTVKKDRIVQLFADGVLLRSGRRINWYIAKMKLDGDELEFPGDERERIKAALTKGKIGMDFAAKL